MVRSPLSATKRATAVVGAMLMASVLVLPAGIAWAEAENDASSAAGTESATASAGSFVCELPRSSRYAVCQANVFKAQNQILEVTNVSSAGRQITARARDAAGNVTSGRSMSEGQTRILVNAGPSSTFRVEARTRFPFVSRTRFSGFSQVS